MMRRSPARAPASRSAWRPAQLSTTPASRDPFDVSTRAGDVPPGSTIRRTETPNSTRAPAARALATVLAQRPAPLHAVLRLQAARFEVVTRVDHAAVAPTLVLGRPAFLFY